MDPESAAALADVKAAGDPYQDWRSHQDQYHELPTPRDELRRLYRFRVDKRVVCRPRSFDTNLEYTILTQKERKAKLQHQANIDRIAALMEQISEPTFPTELRFMVMNAVARCQLPYLNLRWSADRFEIPLLQSEALEGIHASSRHILRQTVKKAHFSNTIFTIDLLFQRIKAYYKPTLPAYLKGNEREIRYLELVVPIQARGFWDGNQFQLLNAIADLWQLRPLFPNLKHCILSLHITGPVLENMAFPPGIFDYPCCSRRSEQSTVRSELIALLESFSTYGPGKRRSVRVQYQADDWGLDFPTFRQYGPLVDVTSERDQCGSRGQIVSVRSLKQRQQDVGHRIFTAVYRAKQVQSNSVV